MVLSQPAVVVRAGSKNQIPGSNLRHSAASTPPLDIGTSMDSPLRLSVMVTVSGTSPIYAAEAPAGAAETMFGECAKRAPPPSAELGSRQVESRLMGCLVPN